MVRHINPDSLSDPASLPQHPADLQAKLLRSRQVQQVLYDISRATSESGDLPDLLGMVHRSVGTLFDATNFFVALYDQDTGLFSFPYWVDARDKNFDPQPLRGSFTDYVRKTGQPLLAYGDFYQELIAAGTITPAGPDALAWLGAPLRGPKGIFGVVAVQSYTETGLYTEADLELISFAAEQIAWAIERKQSESALAESEQFVRRALDGLSAHVAVIDETGIILAVNRAWRAFAAANGAADVSAVSEGCNYLAVARAAVADDPAVARIIDGIRSVLDGASDLFEAEYSCHAPDEKRWFVMRVTPLPGGGPTRAVIAHEEITERKQVEDVMYFISRRGWEPGSEEGFFEALVSYLGEALNVEYAFVGELAAEREAAIRTVAFYDKGRIVENYVYDLAGTPCETVVGKDLCYYPEKVQQLFPADKGLARLGVECYVGMPISNSAGGPLGLIVAMSQKPMHNIAIIERVLQMIAERASHELERRQAEAALRESRVRYQSLFDSMMDGYALHEIVLDDAGRPVDYRFLDVNPAWERYTGLKREEVVGNTVRQVLPDIEESWIATFGQVALTGEPTHFEDSTTSLKNHWFDVLAFQTEPGYFAVIFHDVTGRVAAQNALRVSEQRFRQVVEHSMDGIRIVDASGLLIEWNESCTRITGLTREEVIGRPIWEVVPLLVPPSRSAEDLARRIKEEVHRMVADGQSVGQLQSRPGTLIRRPDNALRHIEETTFAIETDSGPMICGIIHDVTDRIEAQNALRANEQRFRAIVEDQTEFIVRWNLDGALTFVNEAYARYLGLSTGQLLGTRVSQFMTPVEWEFLQKRVSRLTPGKPTSLDTYRRDMPDGRSVWQEWTDHGIFAEDGQLIEMQSVGRDVTERKLITDALQEHALRLASLREIDQAILAAKSPVAIAEAAMSHIRLLVPSLCASVVLFDEPGGVARVLSVEGEGYRVFEVGNTIPLGYFDLEQLRKRRLVEMPSLDKAAMPPGLHSSTHDRTVGAYISAPLIVQNQLIGALNTGVADPVDFAPEYRQIVQEVADQVAIAIHQARLIDRVQQHAEELEQRVAERTAELKDANEQLRALTRLKDEFVSNVSHELRTPITSLKLNHAMLGLNPERSEVYLTRLERETERLSMLIEDLLRLSRLDQGRTEMVLGSLDLNLLVMEYAADRSPLAREYDLNLSLNQAPHLPPVRADAGLLGQVLSILLTNALNYTPQGGGIELTTLERRADGEHWVGFRVADNGPGIPAEELSRVFERFFRGSAAEATNAAGTGLGLAIAKEIIERHRGRIEVESPPEGGAIFSVWLPAAEPEAGPR